MTKRRHDPDRRLFFDAVAAGLPIPSARKVADLTPKDAENAAADDPEAFKAVSKAGSLARIAPQYMPEPEPLPEDRWGEYFVHVSQGNRPSQAARAMNVRPIQVYLARQSSVRFSEIERAAEAGIIEDVEDAMLKEALGGDVRAQTEWLRNRAPERWGRTGAGDKAGGPQVSIGTMNVAIDPGAARARLDEIRRQLRAPDPEHVIDAEIVEDPEH